jgi:hypothetical protein
MQIEQMSEIDKKYYYSGFKIAQEFCEAVNPMGNEKEFTQGFIDGFNRSHRTLQQKTGVVLYGLLTALSENYKRGQYDLRNEELCKFAAKIIKEFPDEYFPFI